MQFFRKEKFEHSPLGLWDFKNVDCHFRYFTFMMQTLDGIARCEKGIGMFA